MRRITILVLVLLCSAVSAQTSPSETPDLQRGELLYENHCSGCHESQVHVRKEHKAENLGDIQKQVARWSSELRLDWTGSDIRDVSHFLHQRYYIKNVKK